VTAPAPGPRRRHVRRRSRALAVLLVLAALATTACGLREDDEPRVITDDAVPTELSEQSPASTVPEESSVPQRIYVIETRDAEEVLIPYLAPIPRGLEGDEYYREVIERLVKFRAEADDPFTTAIPPTTGVLDVRLVEGPDGKRDVLEINLNQLEVSGGTRLKLAIAQMVFTATGIPTVTGVRFLLNGSPVAVPLDVGESETGAVVTRSDFPELYPPTTSPTTAPEVAEPVPGEIGVEPSE